ncbi:MAG: hypothetical protein RLZZ232_471, partial [Planctomycetota bacterium]
MLPFSRRHFLSTSAATVLSTAGLMRAGAATGSAETSMKFGLVTYLWGQDMDLPTLVSACEKSGLTGVELRTEHRHGVEPTLTKQQRQDVRRRFQDSTVTLVGYGSNAQFHEADPQKLKANIELTKSYVQLM